MGVAISSRPIATASQICATVQLSSPAMKLLRDGATPSEFAATLLANKQYQSAIDFVAHALPARESIWWGCLCLQHACGGSLSEAEKAAAKAAVEWITRPCEETRVRTKAPGDLVGIASPAGALAIAANQTGGSLGPPSLPSIPPDPYAPAKAVALAVKVVSMKGEARQIAERQRAYVELALQFREGYFV